MGTNDRSKVKCCLCGQEVLRSGWCDNCQRWPINITPRRWHRDHNVDPDGFCWTCKNYFLTRLEVTNGEWKDTGRVSILLSMEENARRLREVMGKVSGVGQLPQSRTQMTRAELERQKQLILGIDRHPVPDEAPF